MGAVLWQKSGQIAEKISKCHNKFAPDEKFL
jgi:hypothetical protein